MDRKKPKQPKAPSLRKVARTYKKTTKVASHYSDGARYFTDDAKSTHLGRTRRTPNFKPKARMGTFGTDVGGKGATKIKKAVRAFKK